MRLPFLHPGPPSGDDHDGLSGGPCASTRLLVGGILWFCLCLGLSLWLASREGGAVKDVRNWHFRDSVWTI